MPGPQYDSVRHWKMRLQICTSNQSEIAQIIAALANKKRNCHFGTLLFATAAINRQHR